MTKKNTLKKSSSSALTHPQEWSFRGLMLSSRSLGGTSINLIIVTVTAAQMLTLSQHSHIPPNTTPPHHTIYSFKCMCMARTDTRESVPSHVCDLYLNHTLRRLQWILAEQFDSHLLIGHKGWEKLMKRHQATAQVSITVSKVIRAVYVDGSRRHGGQQPEACFSFWSLIKLHWHHRTSYNWLITQVGYHTIAANSVFT